MDRRIDHALQDLRFCSYPGPNITAKARRFNLRLHYSLGRKFRWNCAMRFHIHHQVKPTLNQSAVQPVILLVRSQRRGHGTSCYTATSSRVCLTESSLTAPSNLVIWVHISVDRGCLTNKHLQDAFNLDLTVSLAAYSCMLDS